MAVYNRGLPTPNGSDTSSEFSNAPVATQEIGSIIIQSFATVMKTLEENFDESNNDDLIVSITRGINESTIGRMSQTESSRITEGINSSIVKDLLQDTRTNDTLDEINSNVEKILETMSGDSQNGASEKSNTGSKNNMSSSIRESLKDLLTEDDSTSRIIGSKKKAPFNDENTIEGQKNIIIEEQKKKEEKVNTAFADMLSNLKLD